MPSPVTAWRGGRWRDSASGPHARSDATGPGCSSAARCGHPLPPLPGLACRRAPARERHGLHDGDAVLLLSREHLLRRAARGTRAATRPGATRPRADRRERGRVRRHAVRTRSCGYDDLGDAFAKFHSLVFSASISPCRLVESTAGEDGGGARPGGLRSRVDDARRPGVRSRATPSGPARVAGGHRGAGGRRAHPAHIGGELRARQSRPHGCRHRVDLSPGSRHGRKHRLSPANHLLAGFRRRCGRGKGQRCVVGSIHCGSGRRDGVTAWKRRRGVSQRP